MKIIMNEKKYAEELIEKCSVEKRELTACINILSRYLYHEKGLKQTEIITYLDDFLLQAYPDYNAGKWYPHILSAIRRAKSRPLHKIDFVPITQSEIDTICDLKDEKLERLAFTLLCMAKYHNLRNDTNNNWVNFDSKEIFSQAHIRDSVEKRNKLIYPLKEKGLITNSLKAGHSNIQVNFVDDFSPIIYRVTEMIDLGYQYYFIRRKLSSYYQRGKNLKKCKKCGHYFLGKSKMNNEGYCPDCKKEEEEVTVRTRTCIDCGRTFPVLSKDNRSKRCSQCKTKKKSDYDRIRYLEKKEVSIQSDEIVDC